MNYIECDTLMVSCVRKGSGLQMMAANSKEDRLNDIEDVASGYDPLPVYEVEFIPAERRISERCSSLQRLNNPAQAAERRTLSGRRTTDGELVFRNFS